MKRHRAINSLNNNVEDSVRSGSAFTTINEYNNPIHYSPPLQRNELRPNKRQRLDLSSTPNKSNQYQVVLLALKKWFLGLLNSKNISPNGIPTHVNGEQSNCTEQQYSNHFSITGRVQQTPKGQMFYLVILGTTSSQNREFMLYQNLSWEFRVLKRDCTTSLRNLFLLPELLTSTAQLTSALNAIFLAKVCHSVKLTKEREACLTEQGKVLNAKGEAVGFLEKGEFVYCITKNKKAEYVDRVIRSTLCSVVIIHDRNKSVRKGVCKRCHCLESHYLMKRTLKARTRKSSRTTVGVEESPPLQERTIQTLPDDNRESFKQQIQIQRELRPPNHLEQQFQRDLQTQYLQQELTEGSRSQCVNNLSSELQSSCTSISLSNEESSCEDNFVSSVAPRSNKNPEGLRQSFSIANITCNNNEVVPSFTHIERNNSFDSGRSNTSSLLNSNSSNEMQSTDNSEEEGNKTLSWISDPLQKTYEKNINGSSKNVTNDYLKALEGVLGSMCDSEPRCQRNKDVHC